MPCFPFHLCFSDFPVLYGFFQLELWIAVKTQIETCSLGHLGGSVSEASAFSCGYDPGVLGSTSVLGSGGSLLSGELCFSLPLVVCMHTLSLSLSLLNK